MPSNIVTPAPRTPAAFQTTRQLLLSEDCYATTILVLSLDNWRTEYTKLHPDKDDWLQAFFDLHPSVIRYLLEKAYGIKLPKGNFDKLMAAVTLLTTDLFFKDVQSFIPLANILSGDDFEPGVFDPADSIECAWAITEALLLSPPEEDEPFCDEIRHYIAFVLKDEGYVTPPDVLKIALDGDFADQVRYSFTEDPELFQGIYETQQTKTAEVTDIIKAGLLELMSQLKLLPLKHGSTAELEERLRASLLQTEESHEQ